MTFADTLKRWTHKSAASDQRRSDDSMAGGRRRGENENPYLAARRTWNDHVGEVKASRQMWQMLGILSLLIALTGVGGVIYIGSQSRFVPYVVEVDKLGRAAAVAPAQRAGSPDERVMQALVSSFISDVRQVSPDVALQRKAVFRLYSMLAPNDPATAKTNEYLNGSEEANRARPAGRDEGPAAAHACAGDGLCRRADIANHGRTGAQQPGRPVRPRLRLVQAALRMHP